MIKVEKIETYGWEAAVRGMRNPLDSHGKSDSEFLEVRWDDDYRCGAYIGPKDGNLMRQLVAAGSDHSKFMRMLFVTMDVTAPLYWIAEFDTYKVGTAKNSYSFMHKGVAKPFDIFDFSVHDERVYGILSDLPKKKHELIYPYETDECKVYECGNGRRYKVFKNGKVVAEPYEYTDTMGRHRVFGEKECIPTQSGSGYYYLNLGGRPAERWHIHRLVAKLWLDNPNEYQTVNHIDGNKGDNSVENLEWCSLKDNIQKAYDSNLYQNVSSDHARYLKWKNGHRSNPFDNYKIICDHQQGMTCRQLSEKYGITIKRANNIISRKSCENEDLYMLCLNWEVVIAHLNELRGQYLETKDPELFQQIRCLLPCGYNQKFTVSMNYQVLRNIYHSRKGHKLDEWRRFCEIVKSELPYSELIWMTKEELLGSK